MIDEIFEVKMEVRDYECDLQGIVNNAVYHNYLEHARHQYLLAQGIDFNQLVKQKIFLVLLKAETDYLHPLKPNEQFIVTVKFITISKLKCILEQEIIRNNQLVTKCRITAAAINEHGKPVLLKTIGFSN